MVQDASSLKKKEVINFVVLGSNELQQSVVFATKIFLIFGSDSIPIFSFFLKGHYYRQARKERSDLFII